MSKLHTYLLQLGDNSMILGHRLSELCGHGPMLETDIALTNISLDLFGQVRNIFQYAARLQGGEATEDTLAYLRHERQYLNCLLVEQPNTDFAHVIARQFFFDAFQKLQLESLTQSKDADLSAIAVKSLKETLYHLRFSGEWMRRLGGGTEESHLRLQAAVNLLYPFTYELFVETEAEQEMKEVGIGVDLAKMKSVYEEEVHRLLNEVGISIPSQMNTYSKGKLGIHSEQMGYILSDFQYMQRAYPNMEW